MDKETIGFLKQLQHEMKTQDHQYQAHPRFWTVGHYKWELAREGEGDRLAYYDPNAAEYGSVESLREDFFEKLNSMKEEGMSEEDILDELGVNHDTYFFDDLKNVEDDDYDFIEIYKAYVDDEIDYFDERKVHVCNNDTFFLTKSECQRHIDANYYHYFEPHTYARTLFRCPTMNKLIRIIEETDWDKVEVKE